MICLSEKKQVIHVKDLVIKADNVYIEGGRRPYRDPFFGFPKRDHHFPQKKDSRYEEK